MTTPRGVRNHNPGNIRIGPAPWRGKVTPSRDPAFETFDSPVHGIRALAKLLLTYQRKYGLDTIRAIISRWAPPNENDTGAYAAAVARACGTTPDTPFNLNILSGLVAITTAVIRHENGQQPYDMATIVDGCAMALAKT